jgi:hypothetical protein
MLKLQQCNGSCLNGGQTTAARVTGAPEKGGVPARPERQPRRPGRSGNRNRIAERIIADISGVKVLDELVVSDPSAFAKLAAGLVPRDFTLTVSQRLPGGLEADGVVGRLQAIRELLPDASQRRRRARPRGGYRTRQGAWHSGDYVQSPTMP